MPGHIITPVWRLSFQFATNITESSYCRAEFQGFDPFGALPREKERQREASCKIPKHFERPDQGHVYRACEIRLIYKPLQCIKVDI